MTQRTKSEWQEAGVFIGDEVDLSRIADGVVLHPGSRIQGSETALASGCELGAEAPVVLKNCQLGRGVQLKGGFFEGAVFFEGANMGSGAHVRAGTILEEEASGAHTVGLKQTIFMPFVTAGSLINFCDALMAGGTSRKDHSEIGSSYVHFNFTPHQDKATASLLGDVPNGVFLKSSPIFLGGQGGLVGPARMAYGSVIAAGGICRKDVLDENQLVIPIVPKAGSGPYKTGVYSRADRLIQNNLIYIGNIVALREWYRTVRPLFVRDAFDQAVLDGGLKNLDLILKERIKRLGDVADKFKTSFQTLEKAGGSQTEIETQKKFHTAWPALKETLESQRFQPQERFQSLEPAGTYIETIQSLEPSIQEVGRAWLQSIVDQVVG
jgi:UDP-N-acetylglucosamine/UDP-N-acetylgalactosamine diphosphorylase